MITRAQTLSRERRLLCNRQKMSGKQRGFTVVELLIVIVVIGVLAALGVVAYNGIRERAYDAKVAATLNQLEKAYRLYIVKYDVKSVPTWYYSSIGANFYAPFMKDVIYHNQDDIDFPIYYGGGYGRVLAKAGYIPYDLLDTLTGGPNERDPKGAYEEGIQFVTCGPSRVFFVIRSYRAGVSQTEFQDRYNQLDCEYKNRSAWHKRIGVEMGNYASASFGDRSIRYQYVEIDLQKNI